MNPMKLKYALIGALSGIGVAALLAGGAGAATLGTNTPALSLTPGRVAAAFLVAPSDIESDAHTPPPTRDFAPMPLEPFPVPSLVVASVDDPYVTVARAEQFAKAWGADFCNVGELGHINSASKLGLWPQGLLMLGRLLARVKA